MIGVIADDLTGAAELAAIGFRHGLHAEILLDGKPIGAPDLWCLDTDSRSCTPADAAQRAADAARRLIDAGAKWIYKKTDSVLRGNVTPELEAIVRELNLSGALLVPANPSLGRTIASGQYFVRGQRIDETDFALDPKHPRTSPNVLDLVHTPPTLGLSVARPGEALQEKTIVIGEAANLEDIQQWAKCPRPSWLMAGGADFFAAFLPPLPPVAPVTPALDKQLFICGSASVATRQFVSSQARRGEPVFSLPATIVNTGVLEKTQVSSLASAVTSALHKHSRVILQVGLPLVHNSSVAENLSLELVRVAHTILDATSIPQIFVEGGATAVALARSMGWIQLTVAAELARGVVMLSVTRASSSQWLTIKPGSYSWPETFAKRPLT